MPNKIFQSRLNYSLTKFLGRNVWDMGQSVVMEWVRENSKTRCLTKCVHRNPINICWLLYLCHMIISAPYWNTSNAFHCLQYEELWNYTSFSMVNVILCFWSLNFYILCVFIWNYSWTTLIVGFYQWLLLLCILPSSFTRLYGP